MLSYLTGHRSRLKDTSLPRLHSRLPILLPARGILVGIEGTQSASAPTGYEVSLSSALGFILLQLIGEVEEGTEHCGAIVVDQFDEAGLLHQAAELDQMAGALPPLADPIAYVGERAVAIEPIAQHGQALELRRCCP